MPALINWVSEAGKCIYDTFFRTFYTGFKIGILLSVALPFYILIWFVVVYIVLHAIVLAVSVALDAFNTTKHRVAALEIRLAITDVLVWLLRMIAEPFFWAMRD